MIKVYDKSFQIHIGLSDLHFTCFSYCIKYSIFHILISTLMKKNVGSADKIIRLVIAAIFVALYFTNTVTGTLGIILLVLAGVFSLTSAIGFCPLYSIFGLSTCPVKRAE